jgi:hypothetical protein
MPKSFIYSLLIIMTLNSSCGEPNNKISTQEAARSFAPGSFGYDLDFLSAHDSVVLLKSDDSNAQVIVSPKYQAKVFTSTAEGNNGLSFGWVNYKAFGDSLDAHMNAYGGENRLWLGPEGGRFSLFFKPGAKMEIANWKTPAPIDTESWQVVNKTSKEVTLEKEMQLVNYQGSALSLKIERTIHIFNEQEIDRKLGMSIDSSVKMVGYQTENILVNKGNLEWTDQTGMPCIWMLDMFKPSPSTVIVVPFSNPEGKSFDHIATTNYFGQIPGDRIKHSATTLFFKADGKSRGKLGVVPTNAKPVAGSYDPANRILTIIQFDVDAGAKYLNQEWNTTKPSFSGDAVNAYNDGPLANGNQMGPFYEIESVAPAAFLKPGQSLSHHHAVFHFTGDEQKLEQIAQKILGVSILEVKHQF